MNTKQIEAAMRVRYSGSEWALMFNVGNGTGMNQRTWADAVAMNLYPSRGLRIHGFEFKASRSDWLRELKKPDKSVPVQQYCDHWWIVAPPGTIAEGELPPTWGYIEAKNGKLTQKVDAPKLEAKPVDRSFVAAMLRRASGEDSAVVNEMVEKQMEAFRAKNAEVIERAVTARTRAHKELVETVRQFEEASGMTITGWQGGAELGRAAKMVREAGLTCSYNGVVRMRNQIQTMLAQFDKALEGFTTEDGKIIQLPAEVG